MGKAGAGNILRMAVRSICHILRNGEAHPEYGGLRIICCENGRFIGRALGELYAKNFNSSARAIRKTALRAYYG